MVCVPVRLDSAISGEASHRRKAGGRARLMALARLGLMRPLLALLLLLLTARAGAAQFTPTQDLSLKGLTEVDLLVTVGVDALAPDSVQPLKELVSIQLRKAGIRLLSESADRRLKPMGRIRFALASATHGRWTDDLTVRIWVEQTSILARTREAMLMVTWYAEESELNVPTLDVGTSTRALLNRGIDRFLSAWLAANGR
jgi:hypothetical protein